MSTLLSAPFCGEHAVLSSESEASRRRRFGRPSIEGTTEWWKCRLEQVEKQYSKRIDELLREIKLQKATIGRLTEANSALSKRLGHHEVDGRDVIQPKLPNELISIIISFLYDSSITLRTCSLVSKSFLFPARQHLFHNIPFCDIDFPYQKSPRTQTLLHLLDHPLCTFKPSVHRITLQQNLTPPRTRVMLRLSGNFSPSTSKEWLGPILPYLTLTHFPNVRALELSDIDEQTMYSSAWNRFWSTTSSTNNSKLLKQVTELTLHRTSPSLSSSSASLNTLAKVLPSVTRVHFVDTSPVIPSLDPSRMLSSTSPSAGVPVHTHNNIPPENQNKTPIPPQIRDILRVCKASTLINLPPRWERVTVTVTPEPESTSTSTTRSALGRNFNLIGSMGRTTPSALDRSAASLRRSKPKSRWCLVLNKVNVSREEEEGAVWELDVQSL